ncbi:MAG TPA: primosomal protein N' [Clostridiaceae bacterium]|jgi:primosomal protein N' (replication factor Y)|nr:primosomal protein N' [Clostridia bacterium]HJJ12972.1 primosomal protein N' [Clostridiaceae bacterium]
MIAEIIIDSNVKTLNKTFDYNIPKEMESNISIGSRVLIPFGKSKRLEEGFVTNIKESTEYEVKDIAKIELQSLTTEKILLSKWMAKKYFSNISECMNLMLKPGTTTKNFANRAKNKTGIFVSLALEKEKIQEYILNNKIKSEKQIRILNYLIENDKTMQPELIEKTETSRAIIKTLEKNGLLKLQEEKVIRNPLKNKNIKQTNKLKFTEEQEEAYTKVSNAIEKQEYKKYLLYGVTGSGKTEIYLQLIEKVINEGKSAIMLVPEISLTPQMINRFIERFGKDIIAVLHSKLSVGERYDSWERIENGEARIVIGARSAIFAPVCNLGIIIIDEEHDSSYKSEMAPRYNAKEVATQIAKYNNIPLLLGSATPDIVTFYKAQNEDIELLKLSKRANNSSLPNVQVVDLKQELANGNRTMISVKLYKLIQENLKNKKQTILFLNRRGFSTFVMCRDCGYVAKCKNCNISLTYHKKEEKLKCHYCGYEEEIHKICPECGSKKIKYFGTGTQKLELEINKIFPTASTIRMDIDTVTKKNSHEEILEKFNKDKIDILIGTQMIVKGHHFPNVTLVGVVSADGSLNIDDYRASERTFDILVQVAGRAGRENLQGNVIIQTYNPDNYSIQYAKKQNYDEFYNVEIKLRNQLRYPPFCDIIMFGISGETEEIVSKTAEKLYRNLKEQIEKEQIIANVLKPLPAPIDKIKNRYRWRIIIKAKVNDKLIDIINECLYSKEILKNNARIIADINPTNMM